MSDHSSDSVEGDTLYNLGIESIPTDSFDEGGEELNLTLLWTELTEADVAFAVMSSPVAQGGTGSNPSSGPPPSTTQSNPVSGADPSPHPHT